MGVDIGHNYNTCYIPNDPVPFKLGINHVLRTLYSGDKFVFGRESAE